jgi:hypothetical protein
VLLLLLLELLLLRRLLLLALLPATKRPQNPSTSRTHRRAFPGVAGNRSHS